MLTFIRTGKDFPEKIISNCLLKLLGKLQEFKDKQLEENLNPDLSWSLKIKLIWNVKQSSS